METGGSIQSNESSNTQSNMILGPLPRSITIPLQIGYEDTFFHFFDKNHYEAEAFIKKVVDLSVDYFIQKDRKFPVITWKIEREIARFVNISINSDEACLEVKMNDWQGRTKWRNCLL